MTSGRSPRQQGPGRCRAGGRQNGSLHEKLGLSAKPPDPNDRHMQAHGIQMRGWNRGSSSTGTGPAPPGEYHEGTLSFVNIGSGWVMLAACVPTRPSTLKHERTRTNDTAFGHVPDQPREVGVSESGGRPRLQAGASAPPPG